MRALAVEGILQLGWEWRIEVLRNNEFASRPTKFPSCRRSYGYQSCNRSIGTHNHNFLSSLDTFEQTGEMYLGFVDIHFHAGIMNLVMQLSQLKT